MGILCIPASNMQTTEQRFECVFWSVLRSRRSSPKKNSRPVGPVEIYLRGRASAHTVIFPFHTARPGIICVYIVHPFEQKVSGRRAFGPLAQPDLIPGYRRHLRHVRGATPPPEQAYARANCQLLEP